MLALFAQRGLHELQHGLVAFQHALQPSVELAAAVALGRALEAVGEAEVVEEGVQRCVIVLCVGRAASEGIGNCRQGLAEMGSQAFGVGDVFGNFSQPVHIVGEADEFAFKVRLKDGEGVAHHAGTQHFAEGADVGETGWTVAGLKAHGSRLCLALLFLLALETEAELTRLDEGPSLRSGSGVAPFFRHKMGGMLRAHGVAQGLARFLARLLLLILVLREKRQQPFKEAVDEKRQRCESKKSRQPSFVSVNRHGCCRCYDC